MLISFHTELFTLAKPSIVSQKEHCQNLCPESLPHFLSSSSTSTTCLGHSGPKYAFIPWLQQAQTPLGVCPHLSSTLQPPVPFLSIPFSLSLRMKPLTIYSVKLPLLCDSVFSHTLLPLKFLHSSHIYTLSLIISPHLIAPHRPIPSHMRTDWIAEKDNLKLLCFKVTWPRRVG